MANIDVAEASPAISLARLIGLRPRPDFDDLDLVERVERGLPLASVERLAQRLDPQDKSLKYRIVPRSTQARLKAGNKPLSRDLSERVYDMARVIRDADLLWGGDERAAARFLMRPHPLLERRTPFEVARESSAGAELVVKLIGKARAGVAA